MKKSTSFVCALVAAVALPGAVLGQSRDAPAHSMSQTGVAPDNSKSNKVDPSNQNPTADDQKENDSDRKMTQAIRRSVMADKSLSTYAHNAKIVTVNGTVTLNGVVNSQAESDNLAQKAQSVAGSGRVVNKLKVEGAK
jgi:osmotically-inducible protein OsmY